MQRQVLEAFDCSDALHMEVTDDIEVVDNENIGIDRMDSLEDLYVQANPALYPGLKCSVVSATIIIMNMCTVFQMNNSFTDELFRYLSTDLLSQNNKLPRTHYIMHRSIRKLDWNYNNLHACPDGCVLFEDEYASLDKCLYCRNSW